MECPECEAEVLPVTNGREIHWLCFTCGWSTVATPEEEQAG